MARNFYTAEERELVSDIQMLRRMTARVEIHEEPCPLALAQLDELRVLTDKLGTAVRKLQRSIREGGHARPGE